MKKIFCLLPLCDVTAHLQAQTTSFVNGVVAPPGAGIVLENKNADNLSLVAKRNTSTYSRNVSTFPKALAAGTKYDVTVVAAPALMATKITNGQGLLPIAGNAVKVECDYKFDQASRRISNATFSNFY